MKECLFFDELITRRRIGSHEGDFVFSQFFHKNNVIKPGYLCSSSGANLIVCIKFNRNLPAQFRCELRQPGVERTIDQVI